MIESYVCFPYEFTLLSNLAGVECLQKLFVSPTNLHCSQTVDEELQSVDKFVSPTNLHCSQTLPYVGNVGLKFVSPTNLHCSQTRCMVLHNCWCLFPLRIYTALKHCR